ncbi:HlyD family secretion protein [Hyphomicrobium sp.]|jgi:membrane fusion protein (multidrug efflux system)|uniref:HlyD family secretion protein n=1 Tax=Hyphomicrobium sp. TaxID=82 RepID=UPI002C05DE7C|nr:HlyD family secretion protein [Hyphomicrobium sp.]HVZ04548.1 HlyD family secretion protein [Hyphomicrobium sp.]
MQDASSKRPQGQKIPKVQQEQRKSVSADGANISPPVQPKAGLLGNWPTIAGLVALLALVIAGYVYWNYATLYPSTDNAYVQANIVQIAPLSSGLVTEVDVQEFAHVKSGDVLAKLDPAPFEAALKAAEARLTLAKQQATGAAAQSPAAKANVDQAQAGVDQARMELDHATIKAPVDGIIGKVRVRPGSIAKAGMPLFPLVDTSKWWVDANFKETDLSRIEPGQKATITVDIFPSHEFTGKVESVSPASGAAFSLLPSENSTGSWVKTTQRFPVRVSLTLKPDDPEMRIGASATVTVDTTSRDSNSGAQ